MRFFSCVLGASLFLGAGLMLGCGEGGKPMKNQVPTDGPEQNVDMTNTKTGKVKPMPPDAPPPQPPPLPGKSK